MRIYKLKGFARFQRRERIADAALAEAVRDAQAGLVDSNLGGGLIKQRVAREGQGKSGGFRTIIAFRRGDRAVFLYAFAKSERGNIGVKELEGWRTVGRLYLGLGKKDLEAVIETRELVEVNCGGEE